MDKKTFLKSITLLGAGALVKPSLANGLFADENLVDWQYQTPPFTLPKLDYEFSALEPHIDALTMEIHHDKHHAAYVANLNKAVENSRFSGKDLKTIMYELTADDTAVRNNGGGHFNHSFFWKLLTPNCSKKPIGKLAKAIDIQFGSFEKFQEQFNNAAKSRFGSGWAWLSANKKTNELFISSTPNQDNPAMWNVLKEEEQGVPILALDVWEHAYYLHYQNKRPDYISAFWNVVNWEYAEQNFSS
ncbi:MAG TPA: superoxide dismutase [Chitinophagales bacterium]